MGISSEAGSASPIAGGRQPWPVLDAKDLVERWVMHGPVHQDDRQAEFSERSRQS